mmetsp:Transcript_26586/g.44440  ORF Transcript_26586/g.44440 Transcript_26586/m.44440 type:complete len:108 (-) Transcript_26586:367-690(-)
MYIHLSCAPRLVNRTIWDCRTMCSLYTTSLAKLPPLLNSSRRKDHLQELFVAVCQGRVEIRWKRPVGRIELRIPHATRLLKELQLFFRTLPLVTGLVVVAIGLICKQ